MRPNRFIRDVYDALPPGRRVTLPCREDVAYFVRDNADGGQLDRKTVGSWSRPK